MARLHTDSASLLTDLYLLTMAAAHLERGGGEERAVFHLSFRTLPFGGAYAVAAGLAEATAALESLCFDPSACDYLASLRDAGGRPIFGPRALTRLRGLRLDLDVDAIPEGRLVFAHEPLVRVSGPLWQAQLVETLLLNLVNFSTLIATKASRVVEAARGRSVFELGLRRAQGPDGGLLASRAAFLGGAAATSNVLAGQRYGIPVRGTHAHAWVMSFADELSAFRALAEAQPGDPTLLVDTYDTLRGVEHAIVVGRELRAQGRELAAVRLDSGDLAWLSAKARGLLDAAGFTQTRIVVSNDLDEHTVAALVEQGAPIDAFGVGTALVTGGSQSALGGVYKLGALADATGVMVPRVKRSADTAKASVPGELAVRRYTDAAGLVADAIHDLGEPPGAELDIVDPTDPLRSKWLGPGLASEALLVPVLRAGRAVAELPSLTASREALRQELARLDPSSRRLLNPHRHPAGLTTELHARRQRLLGAT